MSIKNIMVVDEICRKHIDNGIYKIWERMVIIQTDLKSKFIVEIELKNILATHVSHYVYIYTQNIEVIHRRYIDIHSYTRHKLYLLPWTVAQN